MHVTRLRDAKHYEAPNHTGVASLRLQGMEASPAGAFWCGLSHILPKGGASHGAAPAERVYFVVRGEIVVATADGETVLARHDSCLIPAGEARRLENRGPEPASILVVMATPKAAP
ncbi:MAG: cupin domain-containing protein [Tagaea sp.]|nr:cupin domain-containing protein [Tagaea sp.]